MKKNVINKLIVVLVSIFCIFSLVTPNVKAITPEELREKSAQEYVNKQKKEQEAKQQKESGSISSIFTKADEFLKKGDDKTSTISADNLKSMSNIIYNILLIIGIIMAVIVGLVIGIQFMTGSVEQKAKVKETLIAYVVGCIVIFGAFAIWKLVVTVLQGTT